MYTVLWGQFSINTSSISQDFIALACANPTRTSQNGVLVSTVWCDFSSGCHYWFHASDQFLLSIFFPKARFCDRFKEIPNDCNGKFGTVCACCHVQKMLSTHMPVYVYVCHMFYSSLGWILVGVGWAPQKEVRWALGQRISPVVRIALSVERQKSCSCHVLIWQDIWWNLRLVQDLWPKCCVRCFELWSSWGKHPSRSGKQIGIWWGASRPANVRLGTSLVPTTDTK